jgi:hypothetical protein
MEKILISNIGNRNILYKSQLIDNKIFKVETEKLWRNFENEKDNISIQIIPNHIDSETLKVVLISTSQENSSYNYQDTVFEGEILQILVSEQYNVQVEHITFDGNPTDENQIFPFYSKLLKKIIGENADSKLVFNDAGGTPQMKMVAKELLAYYLPKENFKVVYSDQNDEKREIERVFKAKYILLKTAQSFVNEFKYDAALKIIEQIPGKADISTDLNNLISMAAKRLNFELEDVRSALKNQEYLKKYLLVFKHLHQKVPPAKAIQFEQLKKDFQLEIFELASICQLYFETANYTLAVATYYRLAEEFFHRFVHSHGHYKLSSQGERSRFLSENFNQLKEEFLSFRKDDELKPNYGLTTLCLYTYSHGNIEIKNVARLFMKTISMFRTNSHNGIDILRNQSFRAHKNNSVTKEKIDTVEPKFLKQILPDIFKALNMPEENIYFTMNRLINHEFMNQ